jgi:signal transduction histidine kinase
MSILTTGEKSDTSNPSAPRAAERAHLLSETLGQLLGARDPDSIVRHLLPKVAAHLDADAFFNFMVNEKGDALYLHFCAGMPEEIARSLQNLHFGTLPISSEEPEPAAVENLARTNDPRFIPAREFGLQTYAWHPLLVGGRILGSLGFASRSRARFKADELEFLRVISQYTAVALDRLCAARDLRKVAAERELAEAQVRYQRDTLERIIQGSPLPEILKRLTGDFEALADRELAASVLLVDEDGCYLRPISARPPPLDWPQVPAPPPVEEFRLGAFKVEPRLAWSTPIMSSTGRILGAFSLQYRQPTEPTAQEVRLVDIATRMVSIAIERKQSEQALKDSQAKLREHAQDLEIRVAERTASLREAVAQTEEFSYSVSHDLRSPLRAMQGYATALMEDYADKLDEQGRHYLHRIVNSSARMDRLIQDILTYSRLSRREFFPQPIILDRLVKDIIQQYPEMQPPNATIICGPLLNVTGHEPSLSQAISNLLSNAVKFVDAETTPKVKVWTEARDGRVILYVQDNGIGVRAEDQHRLFGMFERLHPEKRFPGTGIGLAIVRRAMDRMGGKAGMESDGVNGSRFWLDLPRADNPSS